jgi:peptidoglycan-associated lipoprotein
VLSSKADILKRSSGLTLVIEGHCDERGTTEYNLALGERRARVAYDYLVILGVSPDRLSIVSFGEERPADAGHTEEAWSKNRRDEFRIFE